jgi:hypothetical protein
LTPARVLAALAAAAAIGAIAVAVVLTTQSGQDSTARPVRAGALLTPRTPLFGDTVTAQVEFAGDAAKIVPGSVRVEGAFGPYRKVSRPVLVRKVAGDAEYVVWTAKLRCLDRACVPGKAEKRMTFPRAHVTYSLRPAAAGSAVVSRSLSVAWPALVLYSRVDPVEVQASDPRGEPPWRADIASLLDVTYRTPPDATAAAAFGLSAVLGLLAVVLVAPLRRREVPEALHLEDGLAQAPAPLTPLELALQRLEHPADDEDPEETRRALELVAGELGTRGEEGLRTSAQRLAWSAEAPEAEAARELAKRAREATSAPEASADA